MSTKKGSVGAPPPTEPDEQSEPTPYQFQKSWSELYSQSKLSAEVYAYSVKAWYTHGKAGMVGGNPMDAREPYLGPEIRTAARMCDLLYANPRLWSRSIADLIDLAIASGIVETEHERSNRLNWMLTAHEDIEDRLAQHGIGAVYDYAELTHEERVVIELQHGGGSQVDIATATGKAHGTVKALLHRAQGKLRALAVAEEAA